MTGSIERIGEALQFIPASDRDTWVKMGMALKSELGDAGFDVWEAWSKQSASFNAKDSRDVWKSIRGNGKVTVGTLFHEAKANGWRDDVTYRKPTPEELAERQRMRQARTAKEEAERGRRHAKARDRAQALWAAASIVIRHPYLKRKRVTSYGLRLYRGGLVISGMPCDGCLIVPARDTGGVVHTLEFIHADARGGDNKRFLPGGDYKARYFSIGQLDGVLCIVEGYASGATIFEVTGHAVAVAFSAGNLTAVALALRAKYPKDKIILCADNDRFTPGNPGVTKATEAARAVGGLLAVPRFDDIGPYDHYRGRGDQWLT